MTAIINKQGIVKAEGSVSNNTGLTLQDLLTLAKAVEGDTSIPRSTKLRANDQRLWFAVEYEA